MGCFLCEVDWQKHNKLAVWVQNKNLRGVYARQPEVIRKGTEDYRVSLSNSRHSVARRMRYGVGVTTLSNEDLPTTPLTRCESLAIK